MNKQEQSTFFITGPNRSRPQSKQSNVVQQTLNIPGKILSMDSLSMEASKYVQDELDRLDEEQKDYEKITDLELNMLDFNQQLRRERVEIETTKSALKMCKIVGEAEINKTSTSIKFHLDHLFNKLQSSIKDQKGMSSFIEQQVGDMKNQDNNFKEYLKNIEQRIERLEFELGIEIVKE